ncbi:MAG: FtsX-like permease family protein [Rhodanobacteraceae bacterium]|jgi:putative ABC transport system permease protein|nr:FtsX-like permease family protein [Rhodanobacteraceae bacterium]
MSLIPILRRHARAPGFALIVLLLVGVVVAINATAFGALFAVRWKTLPYADSDRLIELRADLTRIGFKRDLAERFRDALMADRTLFDGVLGLPSRPLSYFLDESGAEWRATRVTPDFTHVLGVAPALGRAFLPDDASGEVARVVLLSDAVWRARFDADPAVLGRFLRFGGTTYTVIGVMPRGFAFPDARTDVWIPLVWSAQERAEHAQSRIGELAVVARLAPGATLAQAKDRLGVLFAHDERLAPALAHDGTQPSVSPLRERYADTTTALALLQAAALVLLAAVIASVANLMLDRLLAQAREQTIRRALGAGEAAIARDIAADLALPLMGGLAFGLAAAPLGHELLQARALLPDYLPQGAGFGAVAFGGGAAAALVLAGVLGALLLARRSLSVSANRRTGGLGHTRAAMLVAQVMLATALTGSVVLLVRSAANALGVARGFDERGVLLTSLDAFDDVGAIQRGETPKRQAGPALALELEALRADVAGLPGVRHAALADMPPFTGLKRVDKIGVPGQPEQQQVHAREVGPGYFAAMGIDFVGGEDFGTANAEPVAIVDARFAAHYLSSVDPVGRHVELSDENGDFHPARILGVVRTVKNLSLEETDTLPTVYLPLAMDRPNVWLVTRARDDAATIAAAVRERVQAHFPHGRIGLNAALGERVRDSTAGRRHLLEAIAGFAIAALALAGLGLAAVLGFAIRRRTAELGVRLALGATPARVRNLVLRQGGALVAAGLVLGGALGLALARLLADRLFGISFTDPASWCVTLALVAVIALLACWLPARRAAATNPIEALRHE